MTIDKLKRILERAERPVVSFAEQRRMDEQVNLRFTASEIASLIRLALAAHDVSKATHEWNDSVRTIIGRDAKSGIDLVALDAALAAVFGEGDDHE